MGLRLLLSSLLGTPLLTHRLRRLHPLFHRLFHLRSDGLDTLYVVLEHRLRELDPLALGRILPLEHTQRHLGDIALEVDRLLECLLAPLEHHPLHLLALLALTAFSLSCHSW